MPAPPPGTPLLRTNERISYGIDFAPALLPGEAIADIAAVTCDVSTSPPSVNMWTSDNGTLTSLYLTGGVDTATATGGGSGYSATVPPLVTVDPPVAGGTQAVLAATVSSGGVVTGLTIATAGAGYPSAPNVTVAPPVSGTTATGTCTVRLDTITVHLDGSAAVVGQWRRVIASADTTYGQTYKADQILFYSDE